LDKRGFRRTKTISIRKGKSIDFPFLMTKKQFYDISRHLKDYLVKSAKDLEVCLSQDLRFRNLNLFIPQKETEQYDIVLISNILDWAKEEEELIKTAATNLGKLVKKNGVVLCSNLVYRKKQI